MGKDLLFPGDSSIIAVASDAGLDNTNGLPCFDLNKPEEIAEFVIERFLGDRQSSQ